MSRYRSEVISPPSFHEMDDAFHVATLRDRLPRRWKNGERDSVESVGQTLGEARDHHLYKKVGAKDWADYCATFLAAPPEAIDELIEGVRILTGRDPRRANIHEDDARRAVAERRMAGAERLHQHWDQPIHADASCWI
jgi:hypothetical protein